MFLREILQLRSSEIAGNVSFSIYSCIFKVFKEGIKSSKGGGIRALCAPRFLYPWSKVNARKIIVDSLDCKTMEI